MLVSNEFGLTELGQVSDDPRVEEDFYADREPSATRDLLLTRTAICYHGWLRVGTGLSLLKGMEELQERAGEVNLRQSAAFFSRALGVDSP